MMHQSGTRSIYWTLEDAELEQLKKERRELIHIVSEYGLSHLLSNDTRHSIIKEPSRPSKRSSTPSESSEKKQLVPTTVSCRVGPTWTQMCDFQNVCYRDKTLVILTNGTSLVPPAAGVSFEHVDHHTELDERTPDNFKYQWIPIDQLRDEGIFTSDLFYVTPLTPSPSKLSGTKRKQHTW